MPLPRKKDDGTNGAPVLDIMKAHVRLLDVEEYIKPYAVTRKSDGAEFMLDPGFNCTVEVVDDNDDGSDDGTKFFEKFKYKKNKNGEWHNQENSKLGSLTEVIKPAYFEDHSIPALEASDLEGFEMLCRIKPKKNQGGTITGSTIEWDTMQPLPNKPVAAVPDPGLDEADFDDIPF